MSNRVNKELSEEQKYGLITVLKERFEKICTVIQT